MVNCYLVLCTLQISLLYSCSSKGLSPNIKSRSNVDILARQRIDDQTDSSQLYREETNDEYAVILSQERDGEFRSKYPNKYATPRQGPATSGNYQQQPQQLNPLVKQASTASIGILFMLLIWRSLAAYELADQFNAGSLRIVAVAPTVLILCANLMGFVINVMKPFNFKNQLKFILAMNSIREFIELLYNIVMLVFNSPNSGISRDVYFGRFFMNVWWLSLCVTFSKSRWVLQTLPPAANNNNNNIGGNNQQQQQQQPNRNYQPAQETAQKYY